jgi:AhpD family alkylhydroperoxidase
MSELYTEHYMHGSAQFKEHAKDALHAYKAWQKEVYKDASLPAKTKELIAAAVGAALRCAYCVESHSAKARARGASEEELAEAMYVAMAINAGATASYAVHGFTASKKKEE